MTEPKLTSAQIVLLAADDLAARGQMEFSEWELSVAVWHRSPTRFGMRGFEKAHPDHKRVMTEIMGTAKDNPVRRGHLEKVRPNYYRMTSLGRAEATRLRERGSAAPASADVNAVAHIYDALRRYADHRTFVAWTADPAEPRTWLGASAFLNLTRHDPVELGDRMREVRNTLRESLAWLERNAKDQMTRGPVGGSRPIGRSEIETIQQFVEVLEDRFRPQIDAIRKRAGE